MRDNERRPTSGPYAVPAVKPGMTMHEAMHQAAAALNVVLCDSCGQPVDEPNRYRHTDCPAPELGPTAKAVIRRIRDPFDTEADET